MELRGLIMHDHNQSSGNGGVITTNGDTLLVIVNASFIRNKVASVGQRETCILSVDSLLAVWGLGGGRRALERR